MKWAPCSDQRAGAMKVDARVDEEPGLLLAEAEQPELIEAPVCDTAVLQIEPFVRGMVLGGR